jgi:hypothetical protein
VRGERGIANCGSLRFRLAWFNNGPNLNIEFYSGRATNPNHVEHSLKNELLEVVAGSAAANNDRLVLHFNLQPLNPATSSLHDLTLDGVFQLGGYG